MKKFMVILAVVAMVGAFTATSMAAEWNFYGSSRMTTFSYSKSKEVAFPDRVEAGLTAFDDTDTTWTSTTNSRIGAKVKASDAVSGRFEFGMGQVAALRLMYGEYNFGTGSLLVGQDYGPVNTIISTSVTDFPSHFSGSDPVDDGDASNLQVGSFYESRKPQIKLKFGGLQLAFVVPNQTGAQGAYTDIDTVLPKIEAAYYFKTDMFNIRPYAGYNSVNFTDPATDTDVGIDSYVVGATGGINFGPMYTKANLYVGQNLENFGRSNVTLYDTAVIVGTDTQDSDQWGGIILVGFKMSDMFNFEAGYSMDHSELDVNGITGENEVSQWYVNCTITLAPGVTITPEFGMTDFGDDEVTGQPSIDKGDASYFGAKWQINF